VSPVKRDSDLAGILRYAHGRPPRVRVHRANARRPPCVPATMRTKEGRRGE